VVLAPWHGQEVSELVRRASLSAARAETAGSDVRLWDGRNGAMTREDLALLADLRLAAGQGELRLVYQPQVDARSGRTIAVEALLRWDSPVHGAVSPARLIPLAERTGLVGRLTDWVLAAALDAQCRWRAQGLELPVSVNLSAASLTRIDLAEWVLSEMRARSLPHRCLVLELTETAATSDLLAAIEALRPLHETGVRLSIDDFGTGYTSLSALPNLPLDELKIDQSFVRRVITSSGDEAIVRSVTELAHRLGLTVVAEGVEDAAIAGRLGALGVDVLQGYYFAQPLPESDLLGFVAAHPAGRRNRGAASTRQRV
jgi:EAL domain-containing protein (putative c-di-GMP-specific phosphodiesterase class I)